LLKTEFLLKWLFALPADSHFHLGGILLRMPHSFQRVNQSLRADRAIRSNAVIVAGLILLAAWIAWAMQTRLPLFEFSTPAPSTGTLAGGR